MKKHLLTLISPLMLIFSILFLLACDSKEKLSATGDSAVTAPAGKSAKAPPLTGGPGVYILANGTTDPHVWKDGKIFPINDGFASSMYVSGNDIYLAGTNFNNRATLWKNGMAKELDTVVSSASVVFVSGNDVYVAGTRGAEEAKRPVFWKNGELQSLNAEPGKYSWTPTHLSVWGNDVYLVGDHKEYMGFSGPTPPVILKNGSEISVIKKSDLGSVKKPRIIVSNGNVYAAGSDIWKPVMKVWINSRMMTLTDPKIKGIGFDLDPLTIFASGNDLYLAGRSPAPVGGGTEYSARLWKNGVEQKLEGFENPETLQKVPTAAFHGFVSDNDVYVLGSRSKARESEYILWKNGVAQSLGIKVELHAKNDGPESRLATVLFGGSTAVDIFVAK
jgi:hypothetical protein